MADLADWPASSSSGATALLGSSISAIGDSLTDADNPANGMIEVYPQIGPRSYLAQAVLASGGRLRYRGVSATSGFTSQQVRDIHLPVVLASSPKPAFCAVLAGRNPDAALATTKTNLAAMWDALAAAGIIPVACTLPPSNLEGASARDHELMAWIVTTAQRKGYPLADFYSPLVATTGGYGTTPGGTSYGFEGVNPVHQSDAGAVVMGAVLFGAIASRLAAPPWIFPAQGAGDTTALYPNPLFLTDTNADHIPDGWQAPGGAPTMALAADATIGKGNAWKITKGAGGTMDIYGDGWNVTAGRRLLISTKLSATLQNVDATRDAFTIDWLRQDLGAVACNIGVARNIVGVEFAAEIIVPAGYTALRPHVQLAGAAGAGGSFVQLAQFTCVDLTAMGF